VERLIKVELLYKLGSDKENEDFYGPSSFTVDSEERIYILDTKNSRVQCFSKEGKFLFSFGRYGRGPGELSEQAKRIKILEDNNLYIIDQFHKTINVYDRNGKYIMSWKISYAYDDIELMDGKYYLSHSYMRVDNKPIHVMNKSGEIWEDDGDTRIGGRAGMVHLPHEGDSSEDGDRVSFPRWGKRNVVSHQITELVMGIAE
jgi:hypothetical protein